MGKDFIVSLDLVKYHRPTVVLPNKDYRFFEGRCALLYSLVKGMQIRIVPATAFDESVLIDLMRTGDALYLLEYGEFPKEIRDDIINSAKDIDNDFSLLKLRARNTLPIQIISSDKEQELKLLSELLDMPTSRVVKDY